MLKTDLTIAVAGFSALLLANAGVLAAEEKYPIWWSPSLELESLDKIDERLRQPFWPREEEYGGIDVYKDGDRASERAEIDSCASLDRLSKEGFYTLLNNDNQILMRFGAICAAIKLLGEAKPAKVSHVRDFVMTPDALNYLPAMIDIALSCDYMCRQYRANERRISQAMFEPDEDVEVKVLSPLKIKVRSEGSRYHLEIVARADFNGDGLDDLLAITNMHVIGGTWGGTTYFLLSRDTPDSVLWVMDAEDYLCTDYECDEHYDEPAALR